MMVCDCLELRYRFDMVYWTRLSSILLVWSGFDSLVGWLSCLSQLVGGGVGVGFF